ncbi:MAG: hypothetical protein OMM_00585 [Candidatus Magnetoglobus multicellularis str. Araruama]|uniref:ATPase domain protein, prokaryote domain protein n=1 Tax=Candidatus Magnetoglobus multicellularis str. Araruama TaxID=890399 RepID=A0A1V1PGP6_9BACT|nr:MAG: hypothetical protein OMM_00585 [Candidatus Magnetoglobus multicellularis str. Araruama]
MKTNNKWVIKPSIHEEIYTDREHHLNYFYNAALRTATRHASSTVLLGQRRMGKTEIFKRVVNRLFFEQDPRDPMAVVPVYYSFPDGPLDTNEFAKQYVENFIRYYIGFYTSQPEIIIKKIEGNHLLDVMKKSRKLFPFTKTFDTILMWHDAIVRRKEPVCHALALEVPRKVSDIDDTSIAVFIDEFQNTRLPQYNFEIVGFMQEAVESYTCPHFVTGSAMSILTKELIGRGSLYGRFRAEKIRPMTHFWGATLARKAAAYFNIQITEEMSVMVSNRCGGNPFYINAVVQQAHMLNKPLVNESIINEVLAVDLSGGFIWGELVDQVNRWITRINDQNITKWVLYLSALDENTDEKRRGELKLENIQKTIAEQEGKVVPMDEIFDVLVKLSRGDLVEYLEFGRWFRRVDDPILIEFLKVWGQSEVKGGKEDEVQSNLRIQYSKLKKRVDDHKGYLAEIYMSQILWNAQQKTLPGKWFHVDKDIEMPHLFSFVENRYHLKSGKGKEIDVIGAAGPEIWVCQSKWLIGKKVGTDILQQLQEQADAVMEDMEPLCIRMWLFAHDGLTQSAEAYARVHQILWSTRNEMDQLLGRLGLRQLPDI